MKVRVMGLLLAIPALVAEMTGCSGHGAVDKGCKSRTSAHLAMAAPMDAVSAGTGPHGTTIIEVRLDASGQLVEAKVIQSSGEARVDRAAMYHVRYSTFAAATCDGKPVAGKVTVSVEAR